MKKILFLSDYGPEDITMTGYATVSRNIVKHLKKKYGGKLHIDIIAINYYGEPYEEYDGTVRVASGKLSQQRLINETSFAQGDDFGRIAFLKEYAGKYDGVFILQDLGVIAPIVANMKYIDYMRPYQKEKTQRPKLMIYFPVDGAFHSRVINAAYDKEKLKSYPKEVHHFFSPVINQLDELDYFDCVLTYTEYGRNEIARQRPTIKHRIQIIPHGIDMQQFYLLPAAEVQKFRNSYFGKNADKIIIGAINRNQPRKDIPTLIFAFEYLKTIWPKTEMPAPFLYLHMHPVDPLGHNLERLLSQTSLVEGKDYMFSKGDNNGQVDIDTLNKIYNSIDMYVSTALGGGWELTVTEAMACMKPCIVPNHTSLAELAGHGSRACVLEDLVPVSLHSDSMLRWKCHHEEVAEAILKIIADSQQTHQRCVNAYNWLTTLNWDAVGMQWCDLWNYFFDIDT